MEKGEFVDLRARDNFSFHEPTIVNNMVIFDKELIPLGVAMQLPKGFEAIIIPRSSSFKHFGIMEANSVGLIDGKITAVIKRGELLENPEVDNQQPSQQLTMLEGSETNS